MRLILKFAYYANSISFLIVYLDSNGRKRKNVKNYSVKRTKSVKPTFEISLIFFFFLIFTIKPLI